MAGFVDSVAGGGGLINLPVLMNLGIDPKLALGTNKLQATFGSGSASWHYARAGTVSPSDCKFGFAVTFLGAALGTWLVQQWRSSVACAVNTPATAPKMTSPGRVGCSADRDWNNEAACRLLAD